MSEVYTLHPLAEIFPLPSKDVLKALEESILDHGQDVPIIVNSDNQILDGRNRFDVCLKLGIMPKVQVFTGTDEEALTKVLDLNLHRRHLTSGQRGAIAAKIKNLVLGSNQHASTTIEEATSQDVPSPAPNDFMAKVMGGKPDEPVGVKEAAKRTGTSPSTVDRSDRVRREGSEALFQALLDGKIETTVAVAALQFTHDEQDQIAESEAPATKVKVLKRRKRELELAEATDKASEALGLKQYSVIYADPAWKFEVRSEKGESRSASNHYPTMDLQDILALNVAEAAHDDCVLFLWATAPMLLQAFLAMSEWGFEYKSHMIWDKEIMGNGYWFRNQHELLLVGTKGDIPAPAMGSQSVSVLRAPRGSHSEKPDACYDMIEGLYPNAPKLEMFARGEGVVRDGWTYWGNEAPSDD